VSPPINSIICGKTDGTANFAVAFVDLSSGVETQMWVYSTIEDAGNDKSDTGTNSTAGIGEDGEDAIVAIVNGVIEVRRQLKDVASSVSSRGPIATVLMGSLHQKTRSVIQKRTSRVLVYPGIEDYPDADAYEKWLVNLENLSTTTEEELPQGLRFDVATLSDCEVAASKIPYPRLPYVYVIRILFLWYVSRSTTEPLTAQRYSRCPML